MFAYVACGALRLARFNVMGSSGDHRFFTGLPIPAAAGLISTFYIFDKHIGQLSEAILPSVVIAVSLLMSFLMVSTVKYWSVKHLKFHGHHHFMYLVWAVLILLVMGKSSQQESVHKVCLARQQAAKGRARTVAPRERRWQPFLMGMFTSLHLVKVKALLYPPVHERI